MTKGKRMSGVMGAVLTGGRSSRFGSDKGLALLNGVTLADHAAAAIAPFVATMVRAGGSTGLPDVPAPGLGPLGGIAAALDHAARGGFDSVLTIGCDMPRVPGAAIEALLRRAPSYCADAPVLGHWPVSSLDQLRMLLSETAASNGQGEGSRLAKTGPSLRSWARSIGAIPVEPDQPIANVNTPADLLAL